MPTRLLRDWTDSERVDQLEPAAEVLFLRLLMKADDFGRFTANPRLLRSLCFPLKYNLDCADISLHLTAIEAAGLIQVYSVGGKSVLEIIRFNQRLRAMRSRYPAPEHAARPEPAMRQKELKLDVVTEKEFAAFWLAYPRKVCKRAAAEKWIKLRPPLDRCLTAIEEQKRTDQWKREQGRFIPHPATWLNRGCWEDVVQVEVSVRTKRTVPPDPEGWRAWLAEAYPKADPKTAFHRAHTDVQNEFLSRNREAENPLLFGKPLDEAKILERLRKGGVKLMARRAR